MTVPAQGTADAQVTLTPANRTTGTFSGRLIATSGTTRVVTAVGAMQEAESFDLTLDGDRTGPDVLRARLDVEPGHGCNPQTFSLSTGQETMTLRLPKGRYEVDAGISVVRRGQPPSTTLASEPEVTLDADRERPVGCDARAARLGAGRRGRHGERQPRR